MKVLVVDDNEVNRRLPMLLLQRAGVVSAEASSAAEALAMVEGDPEIDHVLLDISMPEISGTEACGMLRRTPRGAKLYIVAYTAHAFHSERETIMAAGFDDMLIKPINRQALFSALRLDPPASAA